MPTPEPVLPLSLLDRDRFNGLFYSPLDFDIQVKTRLHLHVLRVENGDFALGGLYKELVNNSLTYVLSRQNVGAWLDDKSRTMEVVSKVQLQFRKPDANAGEGGEVILYSLLEGHLGAPKVLSKMELKTDNNHYVHGSDGVHLLQTDDRTFQLVFGESKMYGDANGRPGSSVKRAIKAAFKSIAEIHDEGFDFETWLVESELLKEALSPEQVAVLSSILLPTPRGEEPVKKSNAFGIFIGYELDVSDVKFEDLELGEIEILLRDRAFAAIQSEIETIKSEVTDRALGGYHFHIYAIPFTKRLIKGAERGIENVRTELSARLGHNEAQKQ